MKIFLAGMSVVLLVVQAEARLPIEELQRQIQIRYVHTTQADEIDGHMVFLADRLMNEAHRLVWKPTPCAAVPPAYPPDLFYGSELIPEEAAFLVQDLLDQLDASQLWSFYITVDGQYQTTPVSRPSFLDTACTTNNYESLFESLRAFVEDLQTVRSRPSIEFTFEGGYWGMGYELDEADTNRQAQHSSNYVVVVDTAFASSSGGGFQSDDYYTYPPSAGFLWEYRYWESWQAWTNYAFYYGVTNLEPNPEALHFTQIVFRKGLALYQPDFDLATIRCTNAEIIVRIDSLGAGECCPNGFSPADMGMLKHYETVGHGESSAPLETLREDVPDLPDPVEGPASRVRGWYLDTDATYSVVQLDYRPIADQVQGCAGCLGKPGDVQADLHSMHIAIGLGADASGGTAGLLELVSQSPQEGIAALSRLRFHAVSDSAQAVFASNGLPESVTAPQCKAIFAELDIPRTNAGFIVDYYMRADVSAPYETTSSRKLIVVQGMQDESIAEEWATGDFSNPGEYWDDTVHVYELCSGSVVKHTRFYVPYVDLLLRSVHSNALFGNAPDQKRMIVKMAGDSEIRFYPVEPEGRLPLSSGKTEPAARDLRSLEEPESWSMSVENAHGVVYRDYTREVHENAITVWRSKSDNQFWTAEVTKDSYVNQAWGWALVRSESDDSWAWDDPVWTEFTYYTNVAENGYGKLKQVAYSDGRWERYEYNAAGDLLKTISPFGDALPDADESLCRVLATTSVQAGAELTTTDIETVLGEEVSRSYTVRVPMQTRSIQCAAAGAAINAPGNRVTITTYVQDPDDGSPFTGKRVSKIEHPDGTLTLKAYPDAHSETEWRGESNPSGTAVVDGTRTEILKNDYNQVVQRKVFDVASSVLIDSETAIDFDSTGRPVEWSYLDGTTRKIVPGCCCGIESETARDGSTKFFEYDPEGRPVYVTSANAEGDPVIERSVYDGAGRLRMRGYTDSEGVGLSPPNSAFYSHFTMLERFEYDWAGRLRSSLNAAGGQTTYSLPYANGLHQVKTTGNPDGGALDEEFYLDGQLYKRTGTAAPHVQMVYGVENGELYEMEILLGDNGETSHWSKAYVDFLGRRYKTEYSDGSFEQSWYGISGQVEKSVDRDGIVSLYEYNGKGEREVVALDRNRNGTIDYAGMDRITKTVSAVASAHSTNVLRTVTQVWDQDNADAPQTTEIREVSVNGLESWSTVDAQETHAFTAYVPAEAKRIDTTTYPDQTRVIVTTVNGQVSEQEWQDSNGATIRTVDPVYGEFGDLIRQVDSQEGTTEYDYFVPRLPASLTRRSRFDSNDTLVVSYAYDDSMRRTAVTNADLSVVHTDYALNGQVRKQHGAGVYPVEYEYDVQGRMASMRTWQDFAASSGVATTTWIYDPTNGYLSRKEYNDGKGVGYTYTAAGRLKTRIWARGAATEYGYDSLGELTNLHYVASMTPDVVCSYDRLGRLKTAANAHATCAYGYVGSLLTSETVTMDGRTNVLIRNYDSLNRSAGYQLDDGSPVTYGYDDAGRLATVGFLGLMNSYCYGQNGRLSGSDIPGRLSVAKGYDGFNRLAGITNSTPGEAVSSFVYAHNALGQRTSMQMHLDEPDGASEWHYQYDAIGQLSNAWKTANEAPMPGRHYGYVHDDIGNRIRTVRGNNASDLVLGPAPVVTSDYVANLLNQYVERTIPAYAEVSGTARADALLSFQNLATGERIRAGRNGNWFHAYMPLSGNDAGPATNLVRLTGVLPGQEPSKAERRSGADDLIFTNQTLTLSAMKTPQEFTYDDDGNLLADGQFAYFWDGENRLIAASNGATVVRNAYDHLGRRISRVIAGVSTNYFFYDGWNPVAEIGDDGNLVSTNVNVWGLDMSGTIQGAGGVGGLLATVRDGKTDLACMDGNGNVVNLIDAADNNVAATYEYGPFGETLRATGPEAAVNPWRFSTKYHDYESGLYYYGYRFYSPSLGRWLSHDPIGEEGNLNLYAFIENNPVNAQDFLGLVTIDPTTSSDGEISGATEVQNLFLLTKLSIVKTKSFYTRVAESLKVTRESHRESGFLLMLDGSLGPLIAPAKANYITDAELQKELQNSYQDWKSKGLKDKQAKFFADQAMQSYLVTKGANTMYFLLDSKGAQVGTYHSHNMWSSTPSPADMRTLESIHFWLTEAGKGAIQPWGFLALPTKDGCSAELIRYNETSPGQSTGISIKY